MLLCTSNRPFILNSKELNPQPKEIQMINMDFNEKIEYSIFDIQEIYMLFYSNKGKIYIYNTKNNHIQIITPSKYSETINSIAISQSFPYKLLISSNEKIYLYEIELDNLNPIFTQFEINKCKVNIKNIIFLNEFQSVGYYNSINRKESRSHLIIIKIENKKIYIDNEIFINQNEITIFKRSPFFLNLLAIGFKNGSLSIFDLENKKIKFTFEELHLQSITQLAFSPINKMLLVSIGIDYKINFYDILQYKHIKTFESNISYYSLCFFYDGKTIACGGDDGIIYIFDLSIGKDPISKIKLDEKHIIFNLEISKSIYSDEILKNIQTKSKESLSIKDEEEVKPKSKKRYVDFAKEVEESIIQIKEEEMIIKNDKDQDKEFLLRNIIEETVKKEISELKNYIHIEIRSLRIELIRQFQNQEARINEYNDRIEKILIEINEKKNYYKEENMKLKKNYF